MINPSSSRKKQPLRLVVLSPHRGDAAFSLALAISAWLREGHAVTIVNVFTRSLHAPLSDADTVHENDRLSYVSAMRRKEDEDFLKLLPGVTMIDLNIKDAPLRLHCPPVSVLEMAVDPRDGAFSKMHKALTKLVATQDAVLVLPLALGHDVDHRVVRNAALALSADLPMAFYEEQPSAAGEDVLDRLQLEIEGGLHQAVSPVVCPHSATAAWKRKAVLLYTSQIDEEIADLIGEAATRHQGNERLWANDAFRRIVKTVPAGESLQAGPAPGNAATI